MKTIIQATQAYELSVSLDLTGYGHHLSFISFVPQARRPEEQVKLQVTLSSQELRRLRDAIDAALPQSEG